MRSQNNAFYAQSGGVTAVINASACGVIERARDFKNKIGKVYAGKNGIIGAIKEDLIDTSQESAQTIAGLKHTPGSAFGSCRYKLPNINNSGVYNRLFDVFKAHDIRYFFYNGGGDSMDTAHKISIMADKLNFPLFCIGIPKTVDNDLPATDNCPGFGSTAKYIATSVQEAALDVISMHETSTKVFIMEVMGRNTGWITASAGLAMGQNNEIPHMLLFPEVDFYRDMFLHNVKQSVEDSGFCIIVASEGIRYADGTFLSASKTRDPFGHVQLGGTATILARMIKDTLGFKYHVCLADYLQRSARHLASKVDVQQAYAAGAYAVDLAIKGVSKIMVTIDRIPSKTFIWKTGSVPLDLVANVEMKLPCNFISKDKLHITRECYEYLLPLIQGEDFPPFKTGLPDYVQIKKNMVEKKLPLYSDF